MSESQPESTASSSSNTVADARKRKRHSVPAPVPVPAKVSSNSKPLVQPNLRAHTKYTVPRLKTGVSSAKLLQQTKTTTTYSTPKPPPPPTQTNNVDAEPSASSSTLPTFPYSDDPSWEDPSNHVHIGESSQRAEGRRDKRKKGKSGRWRQRKRRVCHFAGKSYLWRET